MKFRTTILLSGKTATGIRVPPEVVKSLNAGKRPPVRVTIGDYTYRTTLATMDGEFMLSLSAENREGAGVRAGDEVDVSVEVDQAPRTVEVPPDLAAAIGQKPGAKAAFDGLAYSKRKEFVRQVEDAKTPETRERRIAKIVDGLM